MCWAMRLSDVGNFQAVTSLQLLVAEDTSRVSGQDASELARDMTKSSVEEVVIVQVTGNSSQLYEPWV